MTREVMKRLSILLAIALLATGLAACGGDSGDSTATTGAGQETTAPQGDDSNSGDTAGKAGDDSATTDDSTDDGSGESSGDEEASAPFRTKGGDNSIQDFGEEADAEEVEAASSALTDFMEARADNDWDSGCDLIAQSMLEPLEQLASKSPKLKGKGCAEILSALTGSAPASARVSTLTDGVASLRVEGDRGFALYRGPRGVNYFIPMVKEDGEWKVGAIAPSEFPKG